MRFEGFVSVREELVPDARSDRFRLSYGRVYQIVHPMAVPREKQPIGIAESPHQLPFRDQAQRGDERVARQKLLRAAVQTPQRDAGDAAGRGGYTAGRGGL